MKTRNGFVSNSSSSSFVVAFPKEPKDPRDVMNMMFPESADQDIIECFDHKEICINIAERVWLDVKQQVIRTPEEDLEYWNKYNYEGSQVKSLLDKLIHSFKDRYYYLSGSTLDFDRLINHGELVEIPRGLSDPDSYFGVHSESLREVCRIENELEELSNKLMKNQRVLRDKLGLVDPPYQRDMSDADMERRRKKWALNNAKLKSNEEWIKMEEEHQEAYERLKKKRDKAVELVAREDAAAFLKDNEDKFILFTHYADDTEPLMEHGEIFRNLPYVVISHH